MSRRIGLAAVLSLLALPAMARAQFGYEAVQAPPPLMPFQAAPPSTR